MTTACIRCSTPNAVLADDAGAQCFACDARDAEDYVASVLDLDPPHACDLCGGDNDPHADPYLDMTVCVDCV